MENPMNMDDLGVPPFQQTSRKPNGSLKHRRVWYNSHYSQNQLVFFSQLLRRIYHLWSCVVQRCEDHQKSIEIPKDHETIGKRINYHHWYEQRDSYATNIWEHDQLCCCILISHSVSIYKSSCLVYMGVFHSHGGAPKWSVYFMENPFIHRWLGSTPISGTPHIPLRNSWLVVSTPPKNMSSSVRMTIPNNNVLFVKIGLGRWLVYHLSSFTCCFLGVCYTPLFINQPMGIWDIYDSQFMEKSNLATKPPTYIGD